MWGPLITNSILLGSLGWEGGPGKWGRPDHQSSTHDGDLEWHSAVSLVVLAPHTSSPLQPICGTLSIPRYHWLTSPSSPPAQDFSIRSVVFQGFVPLSWLLTLFVLLSNSHHKVKECLGCPVITPWGHPTELLSLTIS